MNIRILKLITNDDYVPGYFYKFEEYPKLIKYPFWAKEEWMHLDISKGLPKEDWTNFGYERYCKWIIFPRFK